MAEKVAERKAAIEANLAEIKRLKSEIDRIRNIPELLSTMENYSAKIGTPESTHIFKNRKMLQGHWGKIYSMAWDPSSESRLLSAAQDGSLIRWNACTNNKLDVINLQSSWVMSCAVGPDGNTTASGGLDNLVTIYKFPSDGIASTGDLTPVVELDEKRGHTGYISGCAFFDERTVISSSGDQRCIIWDIEEQKAINTFEGHSSDVMGVAVLQGAGGGSSSLCVSGSVDMICKVWDIRDKKADVLTFQGHEGDVNSVCAMHNGNSFVSGSDDGKIILHDLRLFGPLQQYVHEQKANQIGISSVALSHSGRYVFGGYDDNIARGFDTLTGKKATKHGAADMGSMQTHNARVSCLGVNSTGKALCTGGWDMYLTVLS
jgi:guanine nucleotide-binding protein G(I)/G(S)/G(T) subunit beta-1